MKPLIGLFVAVAFLSTAAFSTRPPKNWTLLIVGGTEGYLSPCGCTSPMSGGITRRITALKRLTVEGRTTIIDNGPLVSGQGRQDQLKLETLAESMSLVNVDATRFGLEEARLGLGTAETLLRLTGGDVLRPLRSNEVSNLRLRKGEPFTFGGADMRNSQLAAAMGESIVTTEEAIERLIAESAEFGKTPVLMLRGDEDEAQEIAKRHPAIRLIVCTRQGSPFVEPIKVGETLIVTPGEHGKYVVKLEWDGEKFGGYQSFDLGPEFADDPEAKEVYNNYLARVGREGLLEMIPREPTEDFAGNALCVSCHTKETTIWKGSAHAHALSTLEHTNHDRDPDCVACHVVGLSSIKGFVDRKTTPLLTDVGCESCHGPAKAHAMEPAKNRLAKAGERSCMPCHNTGHSPNFRFDEYWPRIAHGPVDNRGKKN